MNNPIPDCSGWATRSNIKCTDGRTIMKNAFAHMDGKRVPLVWGHRHDDPTKVLGYAILKNKDGDVWTDCYFNNTESGRAAKELVQHGDIGSFSIWANGLKHQGKGNVAHGDIKEVSLVVAGANMGATIENVSLAHSDDNYVPLDDEAVIWNEDGTLFFGHSEEEESEDNSEMKPEKEAKKSEEVEKEAKKPEEVEEQASADENLEHADGDSEKRDWKAIYESMTEEQKNVCAYLVGEALSNKNDEAEHADEDGVELTMKKNVFEGDTAHGEVLSHADQAKIIERAKRLGSMKDAWLEALETNETLAHAVYNDDGTEQKYGIANIDYLFPDYKALDTTPDKIKREDDWVNVVMDGVRKTPFSRIKTIHANITMDEARAKGYIKGHEKKDEVFNLLRRSVDPQTVYKKQKLDKDDKDDITDFDVVAWLKAEMRDMLNEEIARAILIGDGRDAEDEDKIQATHIKPVWTDDDLYAVKVNVVAGADDAATAENALKAMIRNRKKYKGSGNIIFFTSEDFISECLLLEDGFKHSLYKTVDELATKMRVRRIVSVPQFEGLTRAVGNVNKKLLGIALDLRDYSTGSDHRGKIDFFDDFDIDFNRFKYLIETRLSGMLTKPYSALVLEVGATPAGYTAVAEPADGANPKELGYYEKEGTVFRKSADAAVVEGKTYYTRDTY